MSEAVDTATVAVGSALVTGAVFVAPTSVPLPTDATTPLSAAWRLLSLTSNEGLVLTENGSTKRLTVWEGLAPARVVRSDRVEQLKLTPVNLVPEVAKAQFGEDAVTVNGDGSWAVGHHGNDVPPFHIVIEIIPFVGGVQRLCAKVQRSDLGDGTYNGTDYEGRELTLDCLRLPDGMTLWEYNAYTDELSDAMLSALTVGTLALNPGFRPDVFGYEVTTTASSAVVTAAAADSNATIEIKNGSTIVSNGSSASFSSGTNTLTVKVTNGETEKVYTVTVNKT